MPTVRKYTKAKTRKQRAARGSRRPYVPKTQLTRDQLFTVLAWLTCQRAGIECRSLQVRLDWLGASRIVEDLSERLRWSYDGDDLYTLTSIHVPALMPSFEDAAFVDSFDELVMPDQPSITHPRWSKHNKVP